MENDLNHKISYKAKPGRKTKTSGSNVLIIEDNTRQNSLGTKLQSASERANSDRFCRGSQTHLGAWQVSRLVFQQ